MSNIAELTRRIKKSAENRTHEERIKLLSDSQIIDFNGKINKFFTTITPVEVKSNLTATSATTFLKTR